MFVECRSSNVEKNPIGELDDMEEAELIVDGQTVLNNSESVSMDNKCDYFHGQIDIILHPIYLAPCPYIQIYNQNGRPISAGTLRNLINVHKSSRTASSIAGSAFPDLVGMIDEEIEVMVEEHPFSQSICLCPHICGLGERLALLRKYNPPAQGCIGKTATLGLDRCAIPVASDRDIENSSLNSHEKSCKDFYLLNWFILVGPAIGIRNSPSFYCKVEDAINRFS